MRWAVRLVAVVVGLAGASGWAQGTKLWTVGRYEELERGSTVGVAIRNDGTLEAAPAARLLYTGSGNYIWSVAADGAGNVYAGTGGTASGSAGVLRIAPDGTAAKVFSGTELAVQAVRAGRDGMVFAATSPDGKVYRVTKDGAAPAVIFDPAKTAEKSKYIWDLAVAPAGEVYVATGAPAAVYRIAGGKTELLFRTADQHVRCLLLSRSGMLWAGTDGGGVVYRFDPRTAAAKPFAVYAAAQREITALAEDDAGNVYAAGVGSKAGTNLPPLPVTGATGVTVTFVQPGSTGAVSGSTLVPEGSELYRIGVDGAPAKLVSLKEEVVYGLAVRNGALMVATGNRGRVYRVEPGTGTGGRYADVAHLEASQGTAVGALPDGGLLVGTSNGGRVYAIGGTQPIGAAERKAAYTSEVFDAGGSARWGRAEVRADGTSYGLLVRVGNVPSPAEGWSDWIKLDGGAGKLPEGRFAQWKVELGPGTAIDQVALNYLPRNVAPVVDDVVVQAGVRVAPGAATVANTTVSVNFPPPVQAGLVSGLVPPVVADAGPLTGQKDRMGATVRWAAHDDNGDELLFAVWYRGAGEREFRLLKDRITDRFYSFDLQALPDGAYTLKVVASDAPAHPDAEALAGERVSGTFVVDTTPPVVTNMRAVRITFGTQPGIDLAVQAADETSPIAHAEYSLDAGPWQYMEPQGKVSDGLQESYRVFLPLTPLAVTPLREQGGAIRKEGAAASQEHVVAVRVYDRFENVGSAKTIVR